MKKCGIYIIKNNINDKVYIGQSVDIACRWRAHCYSATKERQDSYTQIHSVMRQYGVENFWYEVLEECEYQELDEKEIYYIKKYNSYLNGYNMNEGGKSSIGENNGRHILNESQVIEIRLAYNNHIPFRKVYEKFKNDISKRGLQKVWQFETWRYILPEVYTEDNILWHATKSKGHHQTGSNIDRACTKEEIDRIRKLYSEIKSYKKVGEIVGRAPTTVRKYCLFQEAKKPHFSISVKNIETGLIFDSMKAACKWANCDQGTLKNYFDNKNKSAGVVLSTGEPAHWIKL